MLGISSQYKMLVGALVLSKPECLQECLDKHCWHVKKYKKKVNHKRKEKIFKNKSKEKSFKKSKECIYIF